MTPIYNAGISLYRLAAKLAAKRSNKVASMLDGQ